SRLAAGCELLTRDWWQVMKSCPGNGSGLIQVLTRCQPAWLLLWLISYRQFPHARLRVFGLNDNI
uniref:hypothetical protein n=1 Tax=Escherichia coli TaxID=562 RepID=UPI00129007CA